MMARFVTPVWVTTIRLSKSISKIRLNLPSPSVMASAMGSAPPLSPVPAPRGMMGTCRLAAACTTREVTGVGVPQVTATLDCSAARDEYFRRSGRYVPIITDGGIRTGGDLCKSMVAGADGVMLGTPFAQATEAPGRGYNWGMASPHPVLPRGTRVKVGVKGSLEQILYGPSSRSDGTQNLLGALAVSMGMVGAFNIREFQQKSDVRIAPAVKTEGKYYQLGME